jgi:hypothetical protein
MLVARQMLNRSCGIQDEHFVVTTSRHFANALFDEQITFSNSIGLVVLQACLVSRVAFLFSGVLLY